MRDWLDEEPIVAPGAGRPEAPAQQHAAPQQPPAGWLQQAPASQAPQAVVVKAERIAVGSAKGGAGKTFISSTLAAALVRHFQGLKVALVDCDLAYGQLASTLGMAPRITWADVAALPPEQITPAVLASMLEQHPVGFHILPSAGGMAAMSVTPEIAERAMQALAATFDVVVYDCSDRLEDPATQAALKTASRFLVVTPPDPAAIEAGTRFLDLLNQHGLFIPERSSIVLNQVAPYHDVRAVREAVEARGTTLWDGWGIPVIAEIPLDSAAAEARAQRRVSVLHKPAAPSSKALAGLVERLVPAAKTKKGGGLLGGLLGRR